MTTPLTCPRIGIQYMPHQENGVRWMLDREDDVRICRGGILGDDMGLGKTFQTIGLLKNSPHTLLTLIVCPPALISGWTTELKACGFGVVPVSDSMGRFIETNNVFLTTYTKLHNFRTRIAAAKFGRVILDEGHLIRNGESLSRWTSYMAAAAHAQARWILSATPIQNGKKDWKNLCTWLRVPANIDSLELSPVLMLRRTMDELRGDIAALPPPPDIVVRELSIPAEGSTRAEGRLFRKLADAFDEQMSALLKIELYMRIQQFLVHPQLYIEGMRTKLRGAFPDPDWNGTSTKFSAFVDELTASEAPTIVFCNFRAEMDMVAAKAVALGRPVWSVRGGMGSEAIGEAVVAAAAAAAAGEPVVVIVQIVAGGAGLNLQFCSRILFLSTHWNPAVVHQAVGRAVRIGQSAVVRIVFFRIVDEVADNIDARILELHGDKVSAARAVCASFFEGGVF